MWLMKKTLAAFTATSQMTQPLWIGGNRMNAIPKISRTERKNVIRGRLADMVTIAILFVVV
jgi:hypothetical protein